MLQPSSALNSRTISHGLVAALFALTGPIAIILRTSQQGRLDLGSLNSWIAMQFLVGGALTVWLSWRYRQPLVIVHNLPAVVMLAPVLAVRPISEVVGGYMAAGVLVTAMGLFGLQDRIQRLFPVHVLLASLAGVFAPIAISGFQAAAAAPAIGAPMVAAYFLFQRIRTLGQRIPPVVGALAAGVIAAVLTGSGLALPGGDWLARPLWHTPVFTLRALSEVVLPFVVMAVAVQNGQALGLMRTLGFAPPSRMIQTITGAVSAFLAPTAAVTWTMAGPVVALTGSPEVGPMKGRWAAAAVCGLVFLMFGAVAPAAVAMVLQLPPVLINLVGGLALLPAVLSALHRAFAVGGERISTLVTLLVTLANISLFGIGGPFWGLVLGTLTARLMDPPAQSAEVPTRSKAVGE